MVAELYCGVEAFTEIKDKEKVTRDVKKDGLCVCMYLFIFHGGQDW